MLLYKHIIHIWRDNPPPTVLLMQYFSSMLHITSLPLHIQYGYLFIIHYILYISSYFIFIFHFYLLLLYILSSPFRFSSLNVVLIINDSHILTAFSSFIKFPDHCILHQKHHLLLHKNLQLSSDDVHNVMGNTFSKYSN